MNITQNVSWSIPSDLIMTLESFAAQQGLSLEAVVISLLSQSVEQITGQGSGRCSLRTGLQSEGPRPLPLQQP